MLAVNWISGDVAPPEKKEYYIIVEAREDFWKYRKGDIEMRIDNYEKGIGFASIGKYNSPWKLIAWADILYPNIPEFCRKKLVKYFGKELTEKWRKNNG